MPSNPARLAGPRVAQVELSNGERVAAVDHKIVGQVFCLFDDASDALEAAIGSNQRRT